MSKFRNKYRIESNRWQFWDYSSPGRYFLTICIQDRKCILGSVFKGKMELSLLGEIVKNETEKIPEYHRRIQLDEWVIMPNHVHLLIELGEYDHDNGMVCEGGGAADKIHVDKIHEFYLPNTDNTDNRYDINQYRKLRRNMLIPKLLGKWQMLTSKQMNLLQNTPGQKNWQRDYHDHVIRNEASYLRIKNYIIQNPSNWDQDTFNRP